MKELARDILLFIFLVLLIIWVSIIFNNFVNEITHVPSPNELETPVITENTEFYVVSSKEYNETFGVSWSGQILYAGSKYEFVRNVRRNISAEEVCQLVVGQNYLRCEQHISYGYESEYDLADHVWIKAGVMYIKGNNSNHSNGYVQRMTIDDPKWIVFILE